MLYPTVLAPYAPYLTLILIFVDGLLFGVAIKKAITSIVLIIIGIIVAYFVGLTFVPSISYSNIIHAMTNYASTTHFGGIIITFSVVLFVIGFGLGIWKG